jgi:hypothetical protein
MQPSVQLQITCTGRLGAGDAICIAASAQALEILRKSLSLDDFVKPDGFAPERFALEQDRDIDS